MGFEISRIFKVYNFPDNLALKHMHRVGTVKVQDTSIYADSVNINTTCMQIYLNILFDYHTPSWTFWQIDAKKCQVSQCSNYALTLLK